MKPFEEIKITHTSLSQVNDVSLLYKRNFIVFWWKEVPLGHLWLNIGKEIDVTEFRERVVQCIAPSIKYYCDEHQVVSESWKMDIEKGEVGKLSAFLDDIIKPARTTAPVSQPVEKISVVVCTRNRSSSLKHCIDALLESSDQDFELIIVDNAPDDNSTEYLVKSYAQVRYVREDRKGLDFARNTGALSASHGIVAYTDDDVFVSKNWVARLKECFVDPAIYSVTGQVFPCSLAKESQYIFEKYWSFNKGYVPRLYDQRYFNEHLDIGVPVWEIGAGANMAFRKEIFKLAGLFDEILDVGASGCSGDSEMWYRILAGGWKCKYFPELFVYHNHRETNLELKKQLYNYVRGNVAALLVQHEKFNHKGNLVRLYQSLPRWYFGRLKRAIKGKKEGFIFSEVRGYFSGLQFYRSHKRK